MDYSTPTRPSVATRHPALKHRFSCRGFVTRDDCVVVYESHIELCVIWILSAMPDVVQIIDQPPAVVYVDATGQIRKHTFDFLVVFRDGRRLLIAVKPAAKAPQAWVVARAVAEQLPPGIADAVHVVTDADFTRADRYNAAMLFEASRFPIEEHDLEIDRITSRTAGAVRISDLVDAAGFGGAGFRSVIRLIARGTLVPVASGKRITPEAYVSRRCITIN